MSTNVFTEHVLCLESQSLRRARDYGVEVLSGGLEKDGG